MTGWYCNYLKFYISNLDLEMSENHHEVAMGKKVVQKMVIYYLMTELVLIWGSVTYKIYWKHVKGTVGVQFINLQL